MSDMAEGEWNTEQQVVVTDIRMRFGSMVIFLVKLALAAIPALIILYVLGFIFVGFFVGVFGSWGPHT